MSRPEDTRAAVAEVAGAACCRHPVRLGATTLDLRTGELAERTVLVACKDRRAVLCPACAATYQADAWQLVAAGLRGGKGVPKTVAGHPACFVTLTAPSFGPVHRAGDSACHPRRRPVRCPHGVALDCRTRHGDDDPVAGRPLCLECFDYEGAVLWNARVTVLWQRTSTALAREVARAAGAGPKSFRLSYIKVVEFQRRGLVHLHVLVRADGPEGPSTPPPEWLTAELLAAALERTVGRVRVPGISRLAPEARWGKERSVRVLGMGDEGDTTAVAAYLAKYATKTATEDPSLARSLEGNRRPVLAGVDPHLASLAMAAWELGARPELAHLRLRAHAHTFGYRGHFATKSRAYSTTFGALRAARVAHVRGEGERRLEPVGGTWRYAGRGYRTPGADRLAEVLAEGITGRPRRSPGTSPGTSPDLPDAPEQAR